MGNEELSAIRTLARDFAQRCIAPEARQLDAQPACGFPTTSVIQAQEIGLTVLTAPEGWGGSEDLACATAAVEETAAACSGFGIILASSLWSLVPLVQASAREKAQQLFDGLLARPPSERLVAALIPDSGRQADATARADGDAYFLDGESKLAFDAGAAGLHIVFARDRDTLVCAAVQARVAGMRLSPPVEKLGLRIAACADVQLNGVRVAADRVLGMDKEAARLLALTDTQRHILVGAAAVGCTRCALEQSVRHAQERRKGGKPIGQHDAVASLLADMRVGLESSRAIISRAAETPEDLGLAITARIHATDAACRTTMNAVQVFGGYGYMRDLPLEKMMRDSLQLALIGGSNAWLRVYLNRLASSYETS